MNVSWICDDPGYVGGAELTMAEFRVAAPHLVEFVEPLDADVFVIGNCASCLDAGAIEWLQTRPVVKYVHDLWPAGDAELRAWLLEHATLIFTSPLHQRRFPGQPRGETIPPAVDLERFHPTRQTRRNGKRSGAISVASWRGPGKGGQRLAEFAAMSDQAVAVAGPGAFVPQSPDLEYLGEVPYEQLPQTLWSFKRFVYLPTALEPFGRCVVEAWAAGCRLVVNRNVGATYWIEKNPDALESAATDFWRIVCDAADCR